MTRYDAIVIGAGLGGLSVATMLARQRLSVLLLERHNVPGGYATKPGRSHTSSRWPCTNCRASAGPSNTPACTAI